MGTNYQSEEVAALVENYTRAKEIATPRRMWLFVRMLDLDRAFHHAPLSPDQRSALFLCGVLGLTKVRAGALLGVTERTIYTRWTNGVFVLTNWLNGGIT